MPPKSLFELAVMAVIKNIKLLDSVGDFEYDKVKDILAKIDSPDQLRKVEDDSDYLKGHCGDLWLKLINRHFPVERKAHPMTPDDPADWCEVYDKYKEMHKTSLEGHGNILQAALAGLKQDKEKHTSQIVQASQLPLALRDVSKRSWGSRSRGGAKPSSGTTAMSKIKKEASKITSIRNSAPSVAGPSTTRAPAAPAASANHANARQEAAPKPIAAMPSGAGSSLRLKMASRPFKEAARAAAGATKIRGALEQKAPQALKRKSDETPEKKAPQAAPKRKSGEAPHQKAPQALKRKHDETPEQKAHPALKRKRDMTPEQHTPANDAMSTPVPKRNHPDDMFKSPSDSPAKKPSSPRSVDELIEELDARHEQLEKEKTEMQKPPPRKKKPVNVFLNLKKRVL